MDSHPQGGRCSGHHSECRRTRTHAISSVTQSLPSEGDFASYDLGPLTMTVEGHTRILQIRFLPDSGKEPM